MKFLVFLLAMFSVNAFALQGNNCVVITQQDFGATTVSTKIINSSTYRRCLIFQNQSSSTIYIKFGSAHSGTEGLTIGAGTRWEPLVIPASSIYIKSGAGSATLSVLEGR